MVRVFAMRGDGKFGGKVWQHSACDAVADLSWNEHGTKDEGFDNEKTADVVSLDTFRKRPTN